MRYTEPRENTSLHEHADPTITLIGAFDKVLIIWAWPACISIFQLLVRSETHTLRLNTLELELAIPFISETLFAILNTTSYTELMP